MEVSPNACWDKCLALIRDNVSEQQYKTWFKPIVFESFDETTRTVLLQVPSPFVYEYLEENYVDLLRKVLCRCFDGRVRLTYRVVVVGKGGNQKGTSVVEGDEPAGGIADVTHRPAANQPQTLLEKAVPEIDSQLNPRQSFNNFIEGDSNKLPRSVGMSIAEHPTTAQFNPMFIFGPSGCGKTHLINAIGLRTKQLYPQNRVLYVSARLFQVQYSNAVLQNKTNDFINFYQTIDMLIVDDIQEWMTAAKTQDTFFHIFNHLFRNGKRIILASDRPPVDLQGMNERLLTRFACGLIAELEKPNVQLCIDILNSKIRHDGLSIPEDVVQYIAHTANGSVRDLEGVVNSLMAYSVVYNSNIDLRLAERVIKRAVKVDDKPLTVDEIIETVCRHYSVMATAVNSRSRKRELVLPRQVSMYLAQKLTNMPASRIGKLVGGRDHSTVIHSCSQIEARLKTDKGFSKELAKIEESFRLKR
ncbi:MAG: chromosomal replication initiator protein DnaA [Prevotella sp.]|nr:chromosomal replication initiator protein DnaA [Prevotella sp.]